MVSPLIAVTSVHPTLASCKLLALFVSYCRRDGARRAVPGLTLCGVRAAPERSRVGAVRVKLDHRVEQLVRSVGRLIETDEITEVLAGSSGRLRVVVVVWGLVPGDNGASVERTELVERIDPLQSRLSAGLTMASRYSARPGRSGQRRRGRRAVPGVLALHHRRDLATRRRPESPDRRPLRLLPVRPSDRPARAAPARRNSRREPMLSLGSACGGPWPVARVSPAPRTRDLTRAWHGRERPGPT